MSFNWLMFQQRVWLRPVISWVLRRSVTNLAAQQWVPMDPAHPMVSQECTKVTSMQSFRLLKCHWLHEDWTEKQGKLTHRMQTAKRHTHQKTKNPKSNKPTSCCVAAVLGSCSKVCQNFFFLLQHSEFRKQSANLGGHAHQLTAANFKSHLMRSVQEMCRSVWSFCLLGIL